MDAKKLRRNLFESLADPAQLLRLFDFLPDVYLYVKDVESRFVAINQAQARMKGLEDPMEMVGKTDLDIHPLYWGRQYREEDRRVMQGGVEIPNQVWLVPTGKGRLGTFISSKIPLRGKDGSIIGVAGVMYRIDQDLETTKGTDPVGQATQIISDQYERRLTIADVAQAVDLSVSQLNRRFRAKFQMPPSEYLQRVRVYQASRLLSETSLPVIDVALRCGFFDQAHLTRMFRKWMQITPKEFRKEALE